jgi:SAM-dependent methyltransferase
LKKTIQYVKDKIQRLKKARPLNQAQKSKKFWTDHNVTLHRVFKSTRESIDYLSWRNNQYVDYIKYLPNTGHDKEVIVDYGCGPGHDLIGFLSQSKPKKVYGIDVSKTSLAEARDRLRIHRFECDLIQISENEHKIPIDNESVDYIHCSGVLNHVPSPETVTKEFFRILKPGGYARFMVYNYDSIWVHLYVTHILPLKDRRYASLRKEDAFTRSTDGFDCPISRNWSINEFLNLGVKSGFKAKHLGNAVSLHEMSLLPQRFIPLMDPEFDKESQDFLQKITIDERGVPYVNGLAAGIDGCFEWRKTK